MDNNKKIQKYNLESDAFKERVEFFQNALNINPRDYFTACDDNELSFENGKFFKDVLYKTLNNYLKANRSMFSADFDLDEYMSGISDDDVQNINIIVFDRNKIHEIRNARGVEIENWLQKNLRYFSDKVVAIKDNPTKEKLANIMLTSSVISISGICCEAFIYTYGGHGAMAPVLLEGEFALAEALEDILAALSINPVVVAVIASAVAIAATLIYVAALNRKLVALIVNDTNFDIAVEDIYMKYGKMSAYINDETYKNVIPAKKRENEVYASFFVIEKNFGFYGTECTLRLKTIPNNDSFYLLTANPLSETSRINLELKNDINKIDGHKYSSSELHDRLYSSGLTDFELATNMLSVSGHLNSAHGENAYASFYFNQDIDDCVSFSTPEAKYHGKLRCVGSDKFGYCEEKKCYEIKPGGFCSFSSNQFLDKLYLAEIMSDNIEQANLVYCFGGNSKIELLSSDDFLLYTFPYIQENTPSNIKKSNIENEVFELCNHSNTSSVYLKSLSVRYMQTPLNNCNWMSKMSDSTPLEDINIPGTHDTAAINGIIHTPYACHYSGITKQLTDGIRLLDIRIKIKMEENEIVFVTCHGTFLIPYLISNEYQSLESAFEECKAFLDKYPSETIIMSLKIDHFAIDENLREKAYNLLENLIYKYPIRQYDKKLGTLGNSRGKIVLFNRINSEERFGYPISWKDKTEGSYAYDNEKRDFKVYVQDCWNFWIPLNASKTKLKYVVDTMKIKHAGDSTVVWNYASACIDRILGVYIGPKLLEFFGAEKSNRLVNFGWILMDYENIAYPTDFYGMMDLPSVIISSNFEYFGCSSSFHVKLYEEL